MLFPGPWGKCAFFHGVIAEGRNSVAGMQPDNPWLLRYWARIVKDNGWEEVPGIYNREARQKWLAEELPDHPCYSLLGVKVKLLHGCRTTQVSPNASTNI